jgi:hypothetical protein
MFQYGPRGGAVHRIPLPLAAALAAVLMAVAIRSRSFKEAQASSTIVPVSLLPLVNALDFGGEAPRHLGTGAGAEHADDRVLKGEARSRAGADPARGVHRLDGASYAPRAASRGSETRAQGEEDAAGAASGWQAPVALRALRFASPCASCSTSTWLASRHEQQCASWTPTG